jgi:hypothetical protein
MSFTSIRTTTSYNSGKRYVEFTINDKSTGELYVGVDQGVNNYVAPRNSGPGESTGYVNCVSYKSTGRIFSRTPSLITPTVGLTAAGLATGDVVSLLVNLDDGEISFRKNNVHQRTVAYPSGTATFILTSLGASGQSITTNLSQDVPFVYSAPFGYTDWAGN